MVSEPILQGTVLTRSRDGVLVTGAGGVHRCRVPGKGRHFGMPAPGDRVRFRPETGTADGVVREVLPRETLYRRYVFGRIKEIAANMERLVLIATPRLPRVAPRLVDRMLVGASEGGLEASVVVNKLDLLPVDEAEGWTGPWRRAGYPVLFVSAVTGEGLERLEEQLRGRTSLLAGPSGVGKSTLLNRLIEELDLDTAALSNATGRGVHTTSFTRLFPLPGGGTVADSPGVREFQPVVEPGELHRHFPEFTGPAEGCEYPGCLHLENTRGCAVRAAVEAGEVDSRRYESYLILYRSLSEGPQRGRVFQQGR